MSAQHGEQHVEVAGNGATGAYRVVASLLTVVVVGGLGYGLVQTVIKAAAIFTG